MASAPPLATLYWNQRVSEQWSDFSRLFCRLPAEIRSDFGICHRGTDPHLAAGDVVDSYTRIDVVSSEDQAQLLRSVVRSFFFLPRTQILECDDSGGEAKRVREWRDIRDEVATDLIPCVRAAIALRLAEERLTEPAAKSGQSLSSEITAVTMKLPDDLIRVTKRMSDLECEGPALRATQAGGATTILIGEVPLQLGKSAQEALDRRDGGTTDASNHQQRLIRIRELHQAWNDAVERSLITTDEAALRLLLDSAIDPDEESLDEEEKDGQFQVATADAETLVAVLTASAVLEDRTEYLEHLLHRLNSFCGAPTSLGSTSVSPDPISRASGKPPPAIAYPDECETGLGIKSSFLKRKRDSLHREGVKRHVSFADLGEAIGSSEK